MSGLVLVDVAAPGRPRRTPPGGVRARATALAGGGALEVAAVGCVVVASAAAARTAPG